MVGEAFLRDTMKELSEMTKKAKIKKVNPPYMYEMFNINGYFAGMGTQGPLKLVNPLVDALNDDHHLPKYILFIPDKDLMEAKVDRSAFMIGANLHYIVKQADLHLERRQQDLLNKRPGALSGESPKLIWIRMLQRPLDVLVENYEILSLRGKFNFILEDRLLDGDVENHHIMSIEVDAKHYDLVGNLTERGKSIFWNEVDKAMKKFDTKEIQLRPRKFLEAQNNNSQQFVQAVVNTHNHKNLEKSDQRKLPMPPAKLHKVGRERSRSSRSRDNEDREQGERDGHRCSRSRSDRRESDSKSKTHSRNYNYEEHKKRESYRRSISPNRRSASKNRRSRSSRRPRSRSPYSRRSRSRSRYPYRRHSGHKSRRN